MTREQVEQKNRQLDMCFRYSLGDSVAMIAKSMGIHVAYVYRIIKRDYDLPETRAAISSRMKAVEKAMDLEFDKQALEKKYATRAHPRLPLHPLPPRPRS